MPLTKYPKYNCYKILQLHDNAWNSEPETGFHMNVNSYINMDMVMFGRIKIFVK